MRYSVEAEVIGSLGVGTHTFSHSFIDEKKRFVVIIFAGCVLHIRSTQHDVVVVREGKGGGGG